MRIESVILSYGPPREGETVVSPTESVVEPSYNICVRRAPRKWGGSDRCRWATRQDAARHDTRRRRAGNQLLLCVNSLTVLANYGLGQCIQFSSQECQVRDRSRGVSRKDNLRVERSDGNNSFGLEVISRKWSFSSDLSVDEPLSRVTVVTP